MPLSSLSCKLLLSHFGRQWPQPSPEGWRCWNWSWRWHSFRHGSKISGTAPIECSNNQRRCITRLGHFLECHCCCARVAVAASLRILLNILLSMFLWGALNSYGDKGCFRMHRAPAARRFIIPIEVSLPAPCFSTCPSDPSKFGHVAGHHLPWPWLQNLRETRASSGCFGNTFTRLSPESLGDRTAAAALASAVSRAKPASPL